MRVYRMHPEYDRSGNIRAHWVLDGKALMRLPQRKIGPVAGQWPQDLSFTVGRGAPLDVLFNPDAFICSQRFLEGVSEVCGDAAEWLPVTVEGFGKMYVFHPVRSVALSSDAEIRRLAPGENVLEIREYAFDDPSSLPTCFLIPQPPESPAGKIGSSCRGIYVIGVTEARMRRYRGVDFACVFDSAKSAARK